MPIQIGIYIFTVEDEFDLVWIVVDTPDGPRCPLVWIHYPSGEGIWLYRFWTDPLTAAILDRCSYSLRMAPLRKCYNRPVGLCRQVLAQTLSITLVPHECSRVRGTIDRNGTPSFRSQTLFP